MDEPTAVYNGSSGPEIAVYTGSSGPEIGLPSFEPSTVDSSPEKLNICIEDGNDNLLDELLAPYEIFTLHFITVKAGQDVKRTLFEFYGQKVPDHVVCVISAIGKLSEITLNSQLSSHFTITYKGQYEIQKLSGSIMPNSSQGCDPIDKLSILYSDRDGKVAGGRVGGPLIAATSMMVTVGSFFPSSTNLTE